MTPAHEAAPSTELRASVEAALGAEFARRARLNDPMPGGDDKEGLAALLDRAAQLKKHFQEVLFLEPESRMVDQPSRNLYGPRRRGHGVHHLFCAVNRVLVLREPMRFDKRRRVVLQARESLAPDRLARPDPLNPGSGAAPEIVDQALLLVTR